MLLYLLIAVLLWFVAPLFIAGHVKKRSDKKAYVLLCKIIAVVFVMVALSKLLRLSI